MCRKVNRVFVSCAQIAVILYKCVPISFTQAFLFMGHPGLSRGEEFMKPKEKTLKCVPRIKVKYFLRQDKLDNVCYF